METLHTSKQGQGLVTDTGLRKKTTSVCVCVCKSHTGCVFAFSCSKLMTLWG